MIAHSEIQNSNSEIPIPPLPALPPFVAAPLPAPATWLIPVAIRPYLPPALLAGQPMALPAEQSTRPIRPRPAVDLAELATDRSTPPARPMPAGPLACGTLPDPDRQPLLPVGHRPGRDRPSHAADPTTEMFLRLLLAGTATLRDTPAPFLKMTIPDPFEAINAVGLRASPPDDDPPASTWLLPPRPPLPAVKP